MDRRLYTADDTGAGTRAANRLGGHEPVIAKARIAMVGKGGGDKKLVEAVPAAARNDVGYKFARIQMLRREDKINEAAEVMFSVPNPLDTSHNLDEWWVERRLLARKLLDIGEPKKAYQVARDATPPDRDVYRAEHQFTAGWIALRFLNDPTTAYGHFSRIAEGNDNPIALSRAAYWQGRAAEALKKTNEARAHYQEAAKYPAAYYGQIARAKAGLGELVLPAPEIPADQRSKFAQLEIVRAAELLYAVDARDLVNTMLADLGDKLEDTGALLMLAEVASRHKDARGMLLVGKLALARGYPLEHAAFPTVGVPDYEPVGPPVEPAIVYSIVRQESWFNPKTVSSANALGLMQVTPPAGRYVAKKFNVTFDQKRLLSDMTYNVQMGAAEIGDVIKDYRGSYILAFAAYNAGRGRVKEWVGRYGDPRDPKVDPIDWVERIPFAETRNYVQRVMENVQVYRVRFGGGSKLLIEADLRRGSSAN
jgi:soluble lytic murein transglycosylase